MDIELIPPIRMDQGLRFAIPQGGPSSRRRRVTEILNYETND